MGLTGWLLMWASVQQSWPMHDKVWVLMIISFFQGQSQLWSDLAVVPTVSRHFAHNKGQALGLTKAFVGLSGSLANQIYMGFFEPNEVVFMEFLGLYFAAVC